MSCGISPTKLQQYDHIDLLNNIDSPHYVLKVSHVSSLTINLWGFSLDKTLEIVGEQHDLTTQQNNNHFVIIPSNNFSYITQLVCNHCTHVILYFDILY